LIAFLKSAKSLILINHFRYNPQQQPEKYFYSILLLFKPWRDTATLIGDHSTYTDAFDACKSDLLDALQYHQQLSRLREADTSVKELVQQRRAEMEAEDMNDSQPPPTGGPLQFLPTEAENCMADFENVASIESDISIEDMIKSLNPDQTRIFNTVKDAVLSQMSPTTEDPTEVLRMFVSGSGGTGKSFLIKTIKAYVQSTTSKDVAVAAPTGIAAFNINGLTIHRLLMLPVEHGRTPQYRPMSDDALKIVHHKLRNVVLIILDEVSMISNVTLLFIHLRLPEIFNTEDMEGGWFGKRNLLFFGDLLLYSKAQYTLNYLLT